MQDLTPQQIVEALDRYIIGQKAAKRAAAIAIRNRWRRLQLPEEFRDEVGPANMILIGPTGVGKTEIARRLAALVDAPFIKVEATKYTEVGYVGRDVESMVRDLVQLAYHMVRDEQTEVIRAETEKLTEDRIIDALMPPSEHDRDEATSESDTAQRRHRNREKMRGQLRAGELEDRHIEISVDTKSAPTGIVTTLGGDQIDPEMMRFLEKLMPSQSTTRNLAIRDARKILFEQESQKLIDTERVREIAVRRAENTGIIFIDEIDKLAAPSHAHGPDISRQGVQRDLLPIIEGSTVNTRYGPVRTDHILFIAAGAFHSCKPSDLMPELQGRLPIRVELENLTQADFVRILTEPKNALTRQQTALMATEGLLLSFTDGAIRALADIAFRVNQSTDNIGARRLLTVMEKLMEEISFDAPNRNGRTVEIEEAYVQERLSEITQDSDLSRFIL